MSRIYHSSFGLYGYQGVGHACAHTEGESANSNRRRGGHHRPKDQRQQGKPFHFINTGSIQLLCFFSEPEDGAAA